MGLSQSGSIPNSLSAYSSWCWTFELRAPTCNPNSNLGPRLIWLLCSRGKRLVVCVMYYKARLMKSKLIKFETSYRCCIMIFVLQSTCTRLHNPARLLQDWQYSEAAVCAKWNRTHSDAPRSKTTIGLGAWALVLLVFEGGFFMVNKSSAYTRNSCSAQSFYARLFSSRQLGLQWRCENCDGHCGIAR